MTIVGLWDLVNPKLKAMKKDKRQSFEDALRTCCLSLYVPVSVCCAGWALRSVAG
jgi:hypothetical protein